MDTDATRLEGRHAPAVEEILNGLNDLLQLDHDAIGAYDIAIDKLEDRDAASQITGFRADHERHIRELNRLIAEMGGTPKNEPHATGPFKQALQSLGGLAGDKGLLLAWRTNELQVRTKYDSYASRANHWPHELKRAIDQNALDEERHYAWVAGVLESMGVGTGEGAETDLLNRLREHGEAGSGESLRDRAAHVAESVRDRAVHAADSVREGVTNAADTVREGVANAAGTVRDGVANAAGTVRDGVTGATGSVRERLHDGVDGVSNRISGMLDREDGALSGVTGMADRVRDAAGDVGARADEVRVTVEERMRSHPVQTLLVAGVAGFILGRILR